MDDFENEISNSKPETVPDFGESLIGVTRTFNKAMAKLKLKEREVLRLQAEVTGNQVKLEAYNDLLSSLRQCQEELFKVRNQLTDKNSELDLVRIERNTLAKKVADMESHLKVTIEHMKLDKDSTLSDEERKYNQSLKSLKDQNEARYQKLQMDSNAQLDLKDTEICDLKRKLAKSEGEIFQLERKLSSQQCTSESCKAEKSVLKQAQIELEGELQRAKKRSQPPQEFHPIPSKKTKRVTFNENEEGTDEVEDREVEMNPMPESTAKKTILKKDKSHVAGAGKFHKLFADKFLPKPYHKGDFVTKW